MEEKDFLRQMENLRTPGVTPDASRQQIKLAVMNTKRSATWGIWLLIVPVVFLCCVVIKYLFHWNWGIADRFIEWMAALDHKPGTAWLTPVLFVLLPAVGAVLNLLAITHFDFYKATKELVVSVKIRWLNIILAAISIGVIAVVLLYAIVENSAERAIHRIETSGQQLSK